MVPEGARRSRSNIQPDRLPPSPYTNADGVGQSLNTKEAVSHEPPGGKLRRLHGAPGVCKYLKSRRDRK